MTKMIVMLEWDEESLGEGWMNIDNLKSCLYTKEHTLKELLSVEEIAEISISGYTPYAVDQGEFYD